jgi:hypothetical protein
MKEDFANSSGQPLDVDILDNFEYWILEYGLAFNLLIFIKLLNFLFCSGWGGWGGFHLTYSFIL